MKSSFAPRQCRFFALLAGWLAIAATAATAQDLIVLKSGVTREGRIVGVANQNVQLEVGAGARTGIRLADIAEIRMAAPPEFDAAVTALQQGRATDAIAILQKLNQAFAGLPADWTERAAAMLGDAQLAAGNPKAAEEAYKKFQAAYPGAKDLANLGMARLAVEQRDFAAAQKLLEPLLEGSDKIVAPDETTGAKLSQANLLMGQVLEAEGRHEEALQSYLLAVAVFPQDRAAASAAQARADALRKEHAVIAP